MKAKADKRNSPRLTFGSTLNHQLGYCSIRGYGLGFPIDRYFFAVLAFRHFFHGLDLPPA